MNETETKKNATKKLLCYLSIPLIIVFFIMLSVFVQGSGKRGITVYEQSQSTTINIENGLADPLTFSQEISIPKEATYQLAIEWDVFEPDFIIGCLGRDANGKIAFAFTAAQIKNSNTLPIKEGTFQVEYHILANEADYRQFAKEYELFKSDSDLDTMISQIDFSSFDPNGEWTLTHSLQVYEIETAGPAALIATIIVGLLSIVILFALWLSDRPAGNDLKGLISNIGIRYAAFVMMVSVFQITCIILLRLFAPELMTTLSSDLNFILIIIPVDMIGFPITLLMCKDIPAEKLPQRSLGLGKFLLFVMMGAGICGVGGFLGNIVHNLLTSPFGGGGNPIGDLMINAGFPMRVLAVGILAPIFEELLFRKLLIDRIIKHGEFIAVLMSGLMFGLFHGNFSQFFYATALGFLWAFVYVRTGKIYYTILLHMVINLANSAITIFLLGKFMEVCPNTNDPAVIMQAMTASPDAGLYIALYVFWTILLILCGIVGLIILIVFLSTGKLRLRKLENETSRSESSKAMFQNLYMLPFFLACIGLFMINYLPIIIAYLQK